jgi:hypothetical protein
MKRFATNPYLVLTVLLVVLAFASVFLGSEPWGPN